MSSRIILPYGASGEFIAKKIPEHSSLEGINFPSLDEYYNERQLILDDIQEPELITAIEQQYNEWYSWYVANEEIRNFLAPIVGSSYDKYHLPILYFPRFTPLVDEVLAYNYNRNENLIVMGMRLEKFHVKEIDVIHFFRDLYTVYDWLELNEEDIIYNPSNIGYNPTFGLRIIDYGLNI